MSVNQAIIIGNVGRDPEYHTFADGNKKASFSIATTDRWKDKKTGETSTSTEWLHIVIFNKALIDIVEKNVRKGSKLYICGALKTRKYKSRDGIATSIQEIILSEFKGELQVLDNKK